MTRMVALASLLLLPLLVTLVTGRLVSAGTEAPKCCFASKLHGDMLMGITTAPVSGPPTISTADGQLDADYESQMDRIALHGTVKGSKYNYTMTLYRDYNNKKQYTVHDDGTCTVEDWSLPLIGPCLSDYFTYGGEQTIGSGNNKIVAQVWSGKVDIFDGTILATPDDCTLISQSVYFLSSPGQPGVRSFIGTTFANVVQGSLRKPDILTIPSQCPKGDAVMAFDVV